MHASEFAHLELLAEVDALVARLRRWADDAPAWLPAERCQALVWRLADRAASLRVRLESPLAVATLGGTGAGKSALVNAILGSEVVRTGRQRPTTILPTLICRPDLTPEMLGIAPESVQWIQRDVPALRELVLIDCPDPDTTEEDAETHEAGGGGEEEGRRRATPASNLERLRAILPKCDVLLVAATQQKYRSARVAEELRAAACGAKTIFVQTHADMEDDIRDDWRRVLAETHEVDRIYRIDSLLALRNALAGEPPQGEFADLLDRLTRQMAGAAACRIRRANFLDLVAETLAACRTRLDQAMPTVEPLLNAIAEQRSALMARLAGETHAELLASRRQWEHRLLGQTASRWGFSPFSLVLRAYQGLGSLFAGALLYRARTPAQIAVLGAMEGLRFWRQHRNDEEAGRAWEQTAAACWSSADLRQAALIVEGYAKDAALTRNSLHDEFHQETDKAVAEFIGQASGDIDAVLDRLALRHSGWFARGIYESLLAAMLGLLLFRLGKNFFYDSWLAPNPSAMFGLDFYVSAGFWLALWCLLLLWAFCNRLRRGLRSEIDRLADRWRDKSATTKLFAGLDADCRRIERFRQDLFAMKEEVASLRQRIGRIS